MTAHKATPIMKNLTVRNVPDHLHEALHMEKGRRGTSLNQTVIDLLAERLTLTRHYSNGLARFAGTWSAEQTEEFEQAVRFTEELDEELWR